MLCFNHEKEHLYPTWQKIKKDALKTIDKCHTNKILLQMHLIMEKQLSFSIQCIHDFTLALNATIFSNTSKNILSFPCMEMFNGFKWLEKSATNNNLAIHSFSLNQLTSSCFCSFKKEPTILCRIATLFL